MGERASLRRELVNSEQLIKIVQRYRVIYDSTDEDYGNQRAKNKAWDSIAKELGVKDREVIRSKWKNLRDSYTKYLRSLDSTQTFANPKYIERYRSWPWVKNMQFLFPYLQTDVTSKVSIEVTPDNDEASSSSTEITVKREKKRSKEEPLINTRLELHNSQSMKRRRSNEEYKDNRTDKHDYSEFDDTDLIFLGYARTLKKMSKRRQASVKFAVAQLIMDAEIEQDDENNTNYDVSQSYYTGGAYQDQDNLDPLSSQEESDEEKPIIQGK